MRYILIISIFLCATAVQGQQNNSEKIYQGNPGITLAQATDSVNYILSSLTYKPHQFQLTVSQNGEAKITLGDSHFPFNFLELKNSPSASGYQVNGIELLFYTPGTRAENDFINFYKGDEQVAFIKLEPTPRAILIQLHHLLIRISELVQKNKMQK